MTPDVSQSPWMPLRDTEDHLAGILSKVIARECANDSGRFCDLRQSQRVILAADFSGDHEESDYRVIGFAAMDSATVDTWKVHMQKLRRDTPLKRRRMSFKELRDRVRLKALPRYLGTMQVLHGYCLVVALNKKLGPLAEVQLTGALAPLAQWKDNVRQRAVHIATVGAFLASSVCGTGADITLAVDADEMASDRQRFSEFQSLFRVCTHNLAARQFGTLEACTTLDPTKNLFVDDLCAIADLSAGAVMHALRRVRDKQPPQDPAGDFTLSRDDLGERAIVWDWCFDRGPGLTRIVAVVDPAPAPRCGHVRVLGYGPEPPQPSA